MTKTQRVRLWFARRLVRSLGYVVAENVKVERVFRAVWDLNVTLARSGWLFDGTPAKLHLQKRLRPLRQAARQTLDELGRSTYGH